MGYLVFDGVNDIVTFSSAMTGNAGTSAYTMRMKSGPGGITLPASGLAAFIGTSTNSAQTGIMTNSTGRLMIYTSASLRYGSTNGFIQSGVPFDITLTHNADGTWNFYDNINSVTNSSGTFTANTLFGNLNCFGRASSTNTTHLQGQIEFIEVTGLANSEKWDANLSGGTGSVLPTVSGNNQGNLVNFPTDGSQWGGFSATVTASANFNMPQMAVAMASTITAPAYSADVSVTMPQMNVSASSTVDAPVFTASASFSMPQMQASSAGNVLSPGVGASVDFTMPQMVVAIDAASAAPAYTAELNVTMPQMSVNAAADVVVSGVSGSVAFSMPQFTVTASGSSDAPTLSASISFSMPQMVVQVSTFEAEYFAVENIDIPAASASIELIAASRHIEYTNQSSHLEWRA